MKRLTDEQFVCRDCGHRGPAIADFVFETVPYGDGGFTYEAMNDAECEQCGGYNIVPECEIDFDAET